MSLISSTQNALLVNRNLASYKGIGDAAASLAAGMERLSSGLRINSSSDQDGVPIGRASTTAVISERALVQGNGAWNSGTGNRTRLAVSEGGVFHDNLFRISGTNNDSVVATFGTNASNNSLITRGENNSNAVVGSGNEVTVIGSGNYVTSETNNATIDIQGENNHVVSSLSDAGWNVQVKGKNLAVNIGHAFNGDAIVTPQTAGADQAYSVAIDQENKTISITSNGYDQSALENRTQAYVQAAADAAPLGQSLDPQQQEQQSYTMRRLITPPPGLSMATPEASQILKLF